MKINFTTENLERLKALFLELGFTRDALPGKFAANVYTVWEILHLLSIQTLEGLFNTLEKEIDAIRKRGRNKWLDTTASTAKIEKLEKWYEFVDLVLGYKLYQEEKEKRASKIAEAHKELKTMREEVKTPAEKIADKQKEIEELEK